MKPVTFFPEDIQDKYYRFLLKNNRDDKYPCYQIVCGRGAARSFISLGVQKLHFFNPLTAPRINNNNIFNGDNDQNADEKISWDPCSLELYEAISLIMIKWRKFFYGGVLFDIRNKLINAPTSMPESKDVKAINTILNRFGAKHGIPLSQQLEQYRLTNPNFRNFTFTSLKNHFGSTYTCNF